MTHSPLTGIYFRHDANPNRGLGTEASRQVADRVDRIPHRRYVEPFVGRGDVYRAVRPVASEVINDLDCSRTRLAATKSCAIGHGGSARQCERIRGASVTCGRDWKEFLRLDSPETLFFLDPPWEGYSKRVGAERMAYRERTPVPLAELVDRTRSLRGSVVVAYRDAPETRKALCSSPFKCHTIHRQFFGRKFTQLLAVKPARGSS